MAYVQSYGAYRLRTKSSVKCSPCVAAASGAGVDNHLLGQIRGGLALDAAPDASKRSTAPVAARPNQEGHAKTAPQGPNGSQGLEANAWAPTRREPAFCDRMQLDHDIARHIPLDRVMAIRYNWKDISRLVRIDTRQLVWEAVNPK